MKVADRGKSHQWEGRYRREGKYVEEEGPGGRLEQEGRVEGRGAIKGRLDWSTLLWLRAGGRTCQGLVPQCPKAEEGS